MLACRFRSPCRQAPARSFESYSCSQALRQGALCDGSASTVDADRFFSMGDFPDLRACHVDSAADGSVNSGGDVNEAERHVAFVLFERVPLDRVRGGKDTVLERPLYFSQVFICHRERGALWYDMG
eukprot:7270547-Prymnesium_polylepis.1